MNIEPQNINECDMTATMKQIMGNRPVFLTVKDACLYAQSLQVDTGVCLAVVECDDNTFRLATFEQWKRISIEREQEN